MLDKRQSPTASHDPDYGSTGDSRMNQSAGHTASASGTGHTASAGGAGHGASASATGHTASQASASATGPAAFQTGASHTGPAAFQSSASATGPAASQASAGRTASAVSARTVPAVDQVDLWDLFRYVMRFWPLLILGALLGAIGMGGLRYMQKYTYTSSSMLYVLYATTSITNLSDLQIGTQLSDDFVVMVRSKPVLDKAIEAVEEQMGITMTRLQVRRSLSISHTDDTRILTIMCTTTDAQLSKVLCDTITSEASQRMSEITQTDPPTLVESAEVAQEPNERGVVSQAEKGALAGLVGMFLILCIPYLVNDKIRRSDDVVRYLDEVVLGVVPYEKSLVFRNGKKGRE